MNKIILMLLVLTFAACKGDNPNAKVVKLNFTSAENNVLNPDGTLVFIGSLGAGVVDITQDSVFMSIPVDDIDFRYRKGTSRSTDKGIVIESSNPYSNVFLILGTGRKGNYFCELNTGERFVVFDVESIEEE
jgi:hypothetical protein